MPPSDDDPLVVILTAIRSEFDAVVELLSQAEARVAPGGSVYTVGRITGSRWQIAVVQSAAGNVVAALQTLEALNDLQPDLLVFVGVAGGRKDVRLGDVVVADKVYGYERGKDQNSAFLPRPVLARTRRRVLTHAQLVAREQRWNSGATQSGARAFIGPIAAGEKVIAHEAAAVAQLVDSVYGDTLAIEMEGYGFLEAAHFRDDTPALVVRGISDLLSGKTAAQDVEWQPRAAKNAAAFAAEYLRKLDLNYLDPPRTPIDRGWATIMPEMSVPSSLIARFSSTETDGTDAMTPDVGQVLDDRFRLGDLIGRGGLSSVYRGVELVLGEPAIDVAIKIYRNLPKSDANRALAEARAIARLNHPNVIPYRGAGVLHDDDGLYVVMQLADLSLGSRIRDPGMNLFETRSLMIDMLSALRYLHIAGYVHGDVKPENILALDRRWCLSDFGLVSFIGEEVPLQGTPHFMAPERFQSARITSAVDIWSLGRTVLAALVDPPGSTYDRRQVSVIEIDRVHRGFASEPNIPNALPPDWRALLKSMLSPEPAGRPTAEELLKTVDSLST